jgi:hypothetical protein
MLTAEQIQLLKKVIEEEVAIQYGAISNYIPEQLRMGYIYRRLDITDYQETLLRIILTGSENGTLPSESLRNKLITSKIESGQDLNIKRNNAGSVILKIDLDPSLIVPTTVDKIKLAKIRYVYNLNFSELLNTTTALEDLIAQLKQEISDLKAKLAQAENQNENFKISIGELETQIQELTSLTEELQLTIGDLQNQISTLSEEHQKEIQQLLADAKTQLDILRTEKDNLERLKNEEIQRLQGKIDNFINLENLERDRIVVQDVFRYWVDVEREEVRLAKEQIRYDLSDNLQYGAYIVDSLEPTIVSDLTLGAMRAALDNNDFSATDTAITLSTRKVANDRHVLQNPENPAVPFFASVQAYLREGTLDTGNARLVQESILMIDLINQNALNQQQTDKLLEFSKRKAPLLR